MKQALRGRFFVVQETVGRDALAKVAAAAPEGLYDIEPWKAPGTSKQFNTQMIQILCLFY
jgi:hypothetical protein